MSTHLALLASLGLVAASRALGRAAVRRRARATTARESAPGRRSALAASPAPRRGRKRICAKIPEWYRVRVCAEVASSPGETVRTSADACRMLQEFGVADADRESLYAMLLSTTHELIGIEEIAKGTLYSVEAHPREVFKSAIVANAATIIVAHNHPSGDSRPSAEDKALTARLRAASDLLGIPILNHLVVTRRGCSSA